MSEERSRRRLARILGQADAEVEDEVRFHLEMQIRDLIAAGWSPESAREEALRMFGDLERVRGEMHSLTRTRRRRARRREYLGELLSDLRFALRRIRKKPGFAFVAILVLSVGIGANAAIFGIVDAALLKPLPFPAGGELVHLWDGQDGDMAPASYPEFQDWQREGDFLGSIAAIYTMNFNLQGPDGPEQVHGGVTGGDLPGVAGLRPLAGRGFLPEDAEAGGHVVMLGEGFWRDRYAAAPDVIGRTLRLSDETYEIVGVAAAELGILAGASDLQVWVPMVERSWMSRGLHFMRVVGRLKAGSSLQEARAQAESMAAGLRESGVTRHGVIVQSLRERLVGDVRPLLLVLWGAVGFLLLIVCTNLASLFLSQAAGRAREFAVRGALGAGRLRLVRQLLTESLLLGALGGAAGLALSRLGTGYVAAAAERAALLATPGIDWRMVAFTAGVALVVSMVFGLTPALRAVRREISADLKEQVPGRVSAGRGAQRFGRLLVGAEIALSVTLLVGAGLMITSVMRLLNEDPGFDPSGVITLEIDLPSSRYDSDEKRVRFFDEVLGRIERLPGVVSAGAIGNVPLSGSDVNGGFGIPGREYAPEESPHSQKQIATPGYFETLRIPLLKGRTFEEGDGREGREVVIISQSLAERYWPGEDPVGQRLAFSWGTEGEQEIVGVVGDVRHEGLDLPVQGTIYVPNELFGAGGLALVVRADTDPLALLPAIRREVLALDPLQPIHDILTLDTIVSRSVTTRRIFMTLLSGFAAVALLLAAVGVYAVTAGSVAGRTREIGVRLAVGAEPGRVLGMIVAEEARVIVPGLLVGGAGAFALSGTLRALLYQIAPGDPRALAFGVASLAAVALAAVLIPARRAAALDPTEALRTE